MGLWCLWEATGAINELGKAPSLANRGEDATTVFLSHARGYCRLAAPWLAAGWGLSPPAVLSLQPPHLSLAVAPVAVCKLSHERGREGGKSDIMGEEEEEEEEKKERKKEKNKEKEKEKEK